MLVPFLVVLRQEESSHVVNVGPAVNSKGKSSSSLMIVNLKIAPYV